jgi:hypothetical protein
MGNSRVNRTLSRGFCAPEYKAQLVAVGADVPGVDLAVVDQAEMTGGGEAKPRQTIARPWISSRPRTTGGIDARRSVR